MPKIEMSFNGKIGEFLGNHPKAVKYCAYACGCVTLQCLMKIGEFLGQIKTVNKINTLLEEQEPEESSDC